MAERVWGHEATETVRKAALSSLRRAGKARGRWWTVAEWGRRWPSPRTVRHLFGSWAAGWEAAGFPVPRRWAMEGGAPRWTRAQVTAILRQASGGKPLSQSAYRSWRERHGGPTVHTIRRLFGSFPAARKAAGLTAPRPDASAVVEAVAALWRELGRRPTRDDWRRWPARPCGLAWLTRQTGSWSRAVEKASRLLRPESVPRHPSAAAEHLLSVSPAHLTPRERQIADLLRAGASLQEAGQKLGLSRERVRQIAKAAGHHRRRPWADLTASRPPVTTPRGDHAATQRHPKTAGR